MKNVFLIGDSIRFGASANPDYQTANSPGYGIYVEKMLDGIANVYMPNDNCRFAQYTLRYLYDWTKDIDCEKIDVVHWNNGLWDVCELFGDGAFTPKEEYVETMLRIARLLKERASIVIFATTTPVRPDNSHNRNEVIEEYNEALVPRLMEMGVVINDLYTPISKDLYKFISDDKIHLSEEGILLASDMVESVIRREAEKLGDAKKNKEETHENATLGAPV